MPTRFVPPITQFVNDNASGVGAGWKLNFYSTGTLVRKDTFSDTLLTIANANPIIADSAGRFTTIFLKAGDYRVILTDENDVQKWDEDPIEGTVGGVGAVEAKTASFTVAVGDSTKLFAVDATSGAITVTLLAAATAGTGFGVTVKKTDSSTNAVTVDGNGAETIDGDATKILSVQNQSIALRSDGSNWHATAIVVVVGADLSADAIADTIMANQVFGD